MKVSDLHVQPPGTWACTCLHETHIGFCSAGQAFEDEQDCLIVPDHLHAWSRTQPSATKRSNVIAIYSTSFIRLLLCLNVNQRFSQRDVVYHRFALLPDTNLQAQTEKGSRESRYLCVPWSPATTLKVHKLQPLNGPLLQASEVRNFVHQTTWERELSFIGVREFKALLLYFHLMDFKERAFTSLRL